MKKFLILVVMVALIIVGFGAGALNSDVKQPNSNDQGKNVFTHTILAELGTSTTCGYCHYAREALDKIYTSGDYPFFYVSLVHNKNTHAAARDLEYNIYGTPTVWFDGGYKVAVGGGTGNEAQYRNYINQCGSRTVKDIDVTLDVTWLGNAAMNIEASVHNNEATQYDGRIRVYVTEVESSMGWYDTTGHPYTFPFLDYAFNQVISISSGGTWMNSITWDGHNYNDGYGHNFGTIQYGNIMVIAAVFNSEWHQGYSYPPSQNPFDAYWVDDSTGFWVGDNTPPNTPSNPNPANGATSVDINKDLSWTGGDPDPTHDTVTYDVYFGTVSLPPLVSPGQSGTTYNPGTMAYGTIYYWKIVATDNHGASTEGPIWHFTTLNSPNQPPNKPDRPSGEINGKINVEYTYTTSTTDPDGDQVYYWFDWGDSSNSGWVGPYASGATGSAKYTWTTKGTYQIKVKAKDIHDAESAWSDPLSVTMPKNYNSQSQQSQSQPSGQQQTNQQSSSTLLSQTLQRIQQNIR